MGLANTSTASTRTLRPGTVLGRYTIVRRAGVGGMAELYLASAQGPEGFEKAVAIKVVHPHLVDDPASIRMFIREARVAAGLDHPNIVQVLDFGCQGGEHYLAMEYVRGRDVRQAMSALGHRQPLPLPCALFIVASVADALQFAHTARSHAGGELSIVHRDVSPSNILLSDCGAVKLSDFGIAKFIDEGTNTGTGVLKGKSGYMSPEQCTHDDLDARSDVFALGVVLYELTTGRRPFTGLNPAALMNRVLCGQYDPPQAVRPDYPPELAAIVAEALAVDVAERTPSARALGTKLRTFATRRGIVLSEAHVAGWLHATFGPPAPLSLRIPAERTLVAATASPNEGATTVVTSPPKRWPARARGRAAIFALGTLGLGTVIGWQIAGASEGQPVPAASTDLKPVPPSQAAVPEVLPPVIAPVLTAASAFPAVGVPTEVPPGGSLNEPPTPDAAVTTKKRGPNKRRRRSEGTRTSAPTPATGSHDAMFPSSARR